MKIKFAHFLVLVLLFCALANTTGCVLIGQLGKACIGFFASFGSEEPETVECPVCGERVKITKRECPVCEAPIKGSSRK